MRRRAWMAGAALVGAGALSVALLATASGGNGPPDDRGRPPGVPASIQMTPDPLVVQCDGIDTSTVTVRVTDARGKPVPDGTEVFFDAVYGFVDPVVGETKQGEASAQAHLYPFAGNFLGMTEVTVSVGPLRAAIGIDCLPPPPQCGPGASPPCPTPVPCNQPFSPPIHPMSPPCTTPPLPCSDTQSPPIGPSPPCLTPTPTPTHEPSCYPQSPPCVVCGGIMSPPCQPTPNLCYPQSPPCDGTPLATPTPIPTLTGTGTIRFESYEPITVNVGEQITLAIEAEAGADPYVGYQWLVVYPGFLGSFNETIAPHVFTLCATPANVSASQPARYGGCLNPASVAVSYAGTLTAFKFLCLGPGAGVIGLSGDSIHPSFRTSFLGALIPEFGGPAPGTVEVTCIADPLPTPSPPASAAERRALR